MTDKREPPLFVDDEKGNRYVIAELCDVEDIGKFSCTIYEGQIYLNMKEVDKDDNLLYVGISMNAMARTYQHSYDKEWFQQVSKITLEWHDDRLLALDAEKYAIKTEYPTHNVTHNR